MARAYNRRIVLLTFIIAVLVSSFSVVLFQVQSNTFYDFDLHYFGGWLEHRGHTYTDLPTIQKLSAAHGTLNPLDGIYGTPILVALLYVPLSFLSLHVAQHIWGLISVVCLLIGTRRAIRSSLAWPLWLFLLCASSSNIISLQTGNVVIATTALLMASYAEFRDQRPRSGGLLLGICIALKAYPAFLLVVLIVQRKWSALRWTLGTVAVTFVASIPILGMSDTIKGYRTMIDIAGYVHPDFYNVGIPGILMSLTHSQRLAHAVSLLLLVGGSVLLYRLRRISTTRLFALATLFMILSQTISWVTYFSLALIIGVQLTESGLTKQLNFLVVLLTGFSLGIWSTLLLSHPVQDTGFVQTTAAILLACVAISLSFGESKTELLAREVDGEACRA